MIRQFTPPTPHNADLTDVITFDVADARTDRFICTMTMPVGQRKKISITEILDFIYSRRPTLKYKKIIIEL